MFLTYLPQPTFRESARCLTDQDLSDSLRAALNILTHNKEFARVSYIDGLEMADDPFAAMWRGYEGTLILYAWGCLSEMQRRDKTETGVLQKQLEEWRQPNLDHLPPWFFGLDQSEKEKIMASHRMILAQLDDSDHYRKEFNISTFSIPFKTVKPFFPCYSPPVRDPIFSR
jgi:hypothetical protein